MVKRRSRLAVWWWPLLLPVALFALALQHGGTVAAKSAGMFPDFIKMPGVSPRGVAVDKIGNVFVSVSQGTHIVIWEYTPDGVGPTLLADMGVGTIGGLMVTAEGDLYVAMAAGDLSARGVWRIDRRGRIERLPGSENIFFANGLAFDEVGTLYVTESVTLTGSPLRPIGPGSIWRIPRGGQAELWWRDELLKGTGALGQPVWIGANGIAYHHDNLYVTNTEKGTVLRIPVPEDGSHGMPDVWSLQPVLESPLHPYLPPMGDGLVLDVHGNLYVAVLTQSALVRINPEELSQETVAVFMGVSPIGPPPDAPLDFPASLFFGTGKGERQNLFVTTLGNGRSLPPPLDQLFPWFGPGLVKINAGVPGKPLR